MADSYKVGSPNNRNVGKHDSNTSNFIPVYGRSIMNDIMMNLLSMGFRHHLLHCRRLKVFFFFTGAAAAAALQAGAERVRKELQANLQVRRNLCGHQTKGNYGKMT